jgi:hypothetical protein
VGILVVCAGLSAGRPARAAKPAATRFFQGTTSGALENTAWLAVDGANVYGMFVDQDFEQGLQLLSKNRKLKKGRFSGRVRNPSFATVGSFLGALSGGNASGSYSINNVGDGQWEVSQAARDAARLRQLAGTYFDPKAKQDGTNLTVKLDARRGEVRVTANAGFGNVSASGKWSADTEGYIWLLILKGPNNIPGLRKETPLRAHYELNGSQLRLLDPFNPDKELRVLQRK